MGNSHEWFLGKIEGEFADMIWANAPVSSSQLVQLAKEKFDWKRTTTHTVIRRLCGKGLFQRDEFGIVTPLISKEEFCARQSEQFVDTVYGGSLPMFVSGFVQREKLSDSDIEEIIAIIKSDGS